MKIYDELIARGLLAQVTDEDEIRDLVNKGKATFYIGFDCTADSLTAGHRSWWCRRRSGRSVCFLPSASVSSGSVP